MAHKKHFFKVIYDAGSGDDFRRRVDYVGGVDISCAYAEFMERFGFMRPFVVCISLVE